MTFRAITAEEHLSGLQDDIAGQKQQLERLCRTVEKLLEGTQEKLQSSYSCVEQASIALAKLQGRKPAKKTAGKNVDIYIILIGIEYDTRKYCTS